MTSIKCEICKEIASKYTCPGCSQKTCSLVCCRKHKEITGCSGQRDKTKFLKKEEFDDLAFLSDYKFLEESSNIIDAAQRQAAQLDTCQLPNSTSYHGFFDNLRKFVHSEFNITLNLMPMQATRHMANKTRFNRASKVVSWSIEFIFHLNNCPSTNLIKLNTKKNLFSSKDSLHNTLVKFYEKYKSDLFEMPSNRIRSNTSLDSSQASTIALYTEFNSIFESGDFNNLNVLLPVTDFELKKKYFIKMNLNENLENLLRNKTLLEYPTLYIVKSQNLKSYNIEDDKKPVETILATELKDQKLEESVENKKKVKLIKTAGNGNLEEGECDSSLSDEFQESDEDNEMKDKNCENNAKRSINDTEPISNKKFKSLDADCEKSLSEDGELEDSD